MAPVFSVRLLVTFSFLSCVFLLLSGELFCFPGEGGGGEGGTKYFERFEELKLSKGRLQDF